MQRLGPTRTRLPGDAPLEFIENHVSIPADLEFSRELDRFLPKPNVEEEQKKIDALWQATHENRKSLIKAMETFQEKLAKKDSSVRRVDPHNCNWQDVMQDFQSAWHYYDTKRLEGVTGKTIEGFRKLGKNTNKFAVWIELLPSGDYGSPICGAFRLILATVGRMHKVRNDIYEAIEEIPDIVSRAQRYLEIYRDLQTFGLSQKVVQLFSAVLIALETIIKLLSERGIKRAGKAFFKGDDYSRIVQQKIERIRKLSTEVREDAEIAHMERSRRMDQEFRIRKANEQSEQQASDSGPQAVNRETVYDVLHQLLLSNPTINRHTRQPEHALLTRGRNSLQNRRQRSTSTATKRPVSRSSAEPDSLTNPQIISLIAYNEETAATDVDRCCSEGEAMSFSDKDRASYVARSSQLQSWLLRTRMSSALLILGNTTQSTAFFSPLSYLVAQVARLYSDTEATATISFFCGLHYESWKDPQANATGLVISLLGQLLSNSRFEPWFDLSFIDDELKEQLNNKDIEALCDLFKTLILQIKEPIVLLTCIDMLSTYETRQHLEETTVVMEMLMELVQETERQQPWAEEEGTAKLVFKLLVTDPGPSCMAERMFDRDDVFLVPEHVDGNMQDVIDMQGLLG